MELLLLVVYTQHGACPGVWVIRARTLHWKKKKNYFSFVSRYHLQIVSWLGKRACVHFPFQCWDPGLVMVQHFISWIHKAMLIPYKIFTKMKVNYLPAHGKCTLYIHLGGCWHANGFCNLLLTRARSKQRDSNSKTADSKTFPTVLPLPIYRESSTAPPHYCHLPLTNQLPLCHEPQRGSWRSTRKVAGGGDPNPDKS